MSAGPPAGWYAQDGLDRYWDGAAWTAHTRPSSGPAAAVPPSGYAVAPQTYAVAGQPGLAVAPKNPALSLIVSFFIPGVGSMVNGDIGKGVGILCLYIVGWVLSIVLIGIPILVGAWVWGLVDGYQGAQRWNLQHGIVS